MVSPDRPADASPDPSRCRGSFRPRAADHGCAPQPSGRVARGLRIRHRQLRFLPVSSLFLGRVPRRHVVRHASGLLPASGRQPGCRDWSLSGGVLKGRLWVAAAVLGRIVQARLVAVTGPLPRGGPKGFRARGVGAQRPHVAATSPSGRAVITGQPSPSHFLCARQQD